MSALDKSGAPAEDWIHVRAKNQIASLFYADLTLNNIVSELKFRMPKGTELWVEPAKDYHDRIVYFVAEDSKPGFGLAFGFEFEVIEED